MRLYLEGQQWGQSLGVARKDYKTFVDGVLADTKRLVTAVDQAGDKLKQLGIGSHASNVALAADLQKVSQTAVGLDAKLDALATSAAATDTRLEGLARESAGLNSRLTESDQRITRLVDDVTKLTTGVSKLDDKLDRTGNELREYARNADRASEATRRLRRNTEAEFGGVVKAARDMRNMLGGFGLGVGAGMLAVQTFRSSSQLDDSLTALKQTAGADGAEREAARRLMMSEAVRVGIRPELLMGGFGGLIAANQTWAQATATLPEIASASAVSKSAPSELASGMTVASSAWGIDLSRPGAARNVLNTLILGGRAGKAEIENLPQILGMGGQAAANAGLSLEQTIGLIEVLAEKTPIDQMGTMLESTVRLFNNPEYLKQAQRYSGVKFLDEKGNGRPASDVLVELAEKYQSLPNKAAQLDWRGNVLKGVDLTTQTGLMTLFGEGSVDRMRDVARVASSGEDVIGRDLEETLRDASDEAGRFAAVMRRVSDSLARPVQRGFGNFMEFALRPKSQGGMELSDGEVLAGGAAAMLGAGGIGLLAKNLGGKSKGLLGKLLGNTAGTAAGVAQGKMLEAAAGVTPVYVTNAGEIGGGVAGVLGMPGGKGGKGLSPQNPMGLLGPGAAFLGGYAVGSYIWDKIDTTPFADRLGGTIATVLAKFGNDEAADAVEKTIGNRPDSFLEDIKSFFGDAQSRWDSQVSSIDVDTALDAAFKASFERDKAAIANELQGRIEIVVDDQRVRVKSVKTNQPGVDLDAHSGMIGATP